MKATGRPSSRMTFFQRLKTALTDRLATAKITLGREIRQAAAERWAEHEYGRLRQASARHKQLAKVRLKRRRKTDMEKRSRRINWGLLGGAKSG